MFVQDKNRHIKDIKVWTSQGLKRRKFPDVIRTDRQTES